MLSRALPAAWHRQCTVISSSTSLPSSLLSCRLLQKNRWDWVHRRLYSISTVAAASSSSSSSRAESSSFGESSTAPASVPAGQAGSGGRRRRRKLFTNSDEGHADASSSSRPEAAAETEAQSRQHHTPDPTASSHRSSTQPEDLDELQQQQQQQGWWSHPLAASQLSVYVFWDLDNLRPQHWDQAGDVAKNLGALLQPCGVLRSMRAYANTRTLVREVEMDGIEETLEEDQLRCPTCGRRCKSFDDLQKHFRQLHEREHQKKMRAPKKQAQKYSKSDKAARVREAARLLGTPKKNRGGRRSQLVKVILQKAGVTCLEVGSQRQAADDAINRHLDDLARQLAASEAQRPSAAAAAAQAAATAAAAAAVESRQGDEVDPYASALQAELSALPTAQACLQQMMDMSESDFRVAWRLLRQFPEGKKGKGRSKLWTQLDKARKSGSEEAPRAPDWLETAWISLDWQQQQQQQPMSEQQQQQQQEDMTPQPVQPEAASGSAALYATEADAAAGDLPPWDNTSTALQQAVLVIVSDDRGFAKSISRWLARSAAGAVVVSTRSPDAWQQPLAEAACPHKRRADVGFVSWEDVIADLDYDGTDDGESGSDWEDPFEGQDPYQWMVAQGLL